MKCPVCKDITLAISERNGIEIDYCPECRGVWLDRGELDKIIEKANRYEKEEYDHSEKKHYKEDYNHNYKEKYNGYPHGKKKKKGFASEIFDIFGD